MADIDSEGKGDIKESTESSASFVRPDEWEHPNTQLNPFGEFQHQEFDASYDHTPFTSVSPAGPSGGTKFIHPFMMEMFVDDDDDIRLRIYGGFLYHTISTLIFQKSTIYGANTVINVKEQPEIMGFTEEEVTGFTALQDDDGNDTVYKAKEYPASESYGDYYVTWIVSISKTASFSAAFSSVALFRNDTPGGAEQDDSTINLLETVDGGTGEAQLRRGSGSGTDHVGTYYAKIGTAYHPDVAETKSKTIEQVLFNHVYWSPTIVAETE